MINPSASATNHRKKLVGSVYTLSAKIPELMPNEYIRYLSVYVTHAFVERIRMFNPFPTGKLTVKVVTTTLFPVTRNIRFLRLESGVVEVIIHVNSLINFHGIDELITCLFS